MSSWSPTDKEDVASVTTKEKTVVVETRTLRVPRGSYLSLNEEDSKEDDSSWQGCWKEDGLLCLEHAILEHVSRGLGMLAEASSPFKTQVVRLGGRERTEEDGIVAWVETLTAPLVPSIALSDQLSIQMPQELELAAQLSTAVDSVKRQRSTGPYQQTSSYPQQLQQGVRSDGTDGVVSSTGEVAMVDEDVMEMVRSQARKARGVEAWYWLKQDIQHAATLFAEEVFRQTTPQEAPGISGGGWWPFGVVNGIADEAAAPAPVDLTVKLELLEKGKCPRFHLDKVSQACTMRLRVGSRSCHLANM